MRTLFVITLFTGAIALAYESASAVEDAKSGAKPAAAKKTANVLTLSEYLDQVKTGNPEGRAATQMVDVLRLRLDEADVPFSSELYSEYNIFDDRKEPTSGFAPAESRGRNWKVGIRDRTTYGLSADAYFLSTRTTLLGAPAFFTYKDYEASTLGLKLKQDLWRNSFGEVDRAGLEAQRAASRKALLEAKFRLKNLLLRAENTYWSLVSYDQVIRLQEENVERAKRFRDWMKQRASMRLFDDVDALQAQAAYEKRDLELQTSIDERAILIRSFNTLRGENSEQAVALAELPTQDFLTKTVEDKSKRMSREDFQIVFEESAASLAQAKAAASATAPELSLVGSIAGQGLDEKTSSAYNEATSGKNPGWSVGLVFSIPLDYSLIHNMRASYRAQKNAATDLREQARFNEQRAWNDLIKQNREAQGRFQRALNLEKLMTDLVEKERRRLINGRSTTFQSLEIEQNLADAQVARVRAQLGLLQHFNVIKQFEAIP